MKVGLCSCYLAQLKYWDPIALWIQKGSFPEFPKDAPLLLIATGTGIAPFRAFIQEREALPSD